MSTDTTALRTYGNFRKPRGSGLLGLGPIGTASLIFGLIAVALVANFSLLAAFIVLAILALTLATVAVRDRYGYNILDRVESRICWMQLQRRGGKSYRAGPLGVIDHGAYSLPGIASELTVTEHVDSYGRAFVLVACPRTRSYTVCISVQPDGAALVDAEQVDVWVARWGAWLGSLSDVPGVIGASATIETIPDSGTRLAAEVQTSMDPDAPKFATAVLEEIVDSYPLGSSAVNGYVTITFSSKVGEHRRKTAEEMGQDIGTRLPSIARSLETTGAGVAVPVSQQRLTHIVRSAFDPHAAKLLEESQRVGESEGIRWEDAGPIAAENNWSSYRHEDHISRSWVMSAAPRGVITAHALHDLLAPHQAIERKRVTLAFRPISAAKTAAIVESDLNSALFRASAANRASARAQTDVRRAQAIADEEAQGASLVNFSIIVTATVKANNNCLADADATISSLSAAARLQLRPAYGCQDSAFIAGLPLGIIVPLHSMVANEIKDSL